MKTFNVLNEWRVIAIFSEKTRYDLLTHEGVIQWLWPNFGNQKEQRKSISAHSYF